MALDTAHVIWGYGSAAADYGNFAPSLALFGLGLVLFTAHYLVLRGFYALEQTRRVFWIQCVIAATNIVAAILLTRDAPAVRDRSAAGGRLRVLLRRRRGPLLHPAGPQVGGLAGRRLVRFLVRLALAVGISAAVAWGLRELLDELVPGHRHLARRAQRGGGRCGLPRPLPRAGAAAADLRGERRHGARHTSSLWQA